MSTVRYKKKDLERICLDLIEKHKIIRMNELIAYLPISKATFYNKNLDKLDTIKDSVNNQKVKIKKGLQMKMYNSKNSASHIALYKLAGTQEECDRLNGAKTILEGEVGLNVSFPDKVPFEVKITGYDKELDDD